LTRLTIKSHLCASLLLATCAGGCAAVPDRPARSSAGCARAAIEQHLPGNLPDKLAHCIAGGLVARYCSPTEARLAGLGKELRDIFGHGNAEWSDWNAARLGLRCADDGADPDAIIACCERTYQR
jgi:hypothetical protein